METTRLKALSPVLTNLAPPEQAYIRIESVVLVDADVPDVNALAARLADDFVTYLKTLTLAQIDGPTGFAFLKEDLKERARVLSAGKVRDVLFSAFIVE